MEIKKSIVVGKLSCSQASSLLIRFSLIASTALFGLSLTSCETSPTGRQQLLLLPEAQVDQIGAQSFQELKSKEAIEKNPATVTYVKCVADAITNALPEKSNWEVVVFSADQVNAFALPGGKIGVYTGLLKAAQTPSQLAAVIGHEVGHVLAQHGRERMSQHLTTQGGMAVLSSILANKGKGYDALMAGIGLGAQYGVLLPYGRAQETEADIVGLELMAKAGFNPQESIQLWHNMAKASGGGAPPEFMSTHPSNETRINTLSEKMGPALAIYQGTTQKPNCRR